MKFIFTTIQRFIEALALLMLMIAGLWFYAVHVEPGWIEVTKHDVEMPGLIAQGDGLRIVQMADFHYGPYMQAKGVRRAVKKANRLKPDVVVLTGDFVSRRPEYAAPCALELEKLESKYGSFAVLGNHDHWEGAKEVEEALVGTGIKLLTNTNTVLPGTNLTLAGIDDIWSGRPDLQKALRGVNPGVPLVLLSHSPKILPRVTHRKVLVITAHTHAGQVDIPGIPRNRIPGLIGWKYIRGWYYEGQARMYVNRGIGMVTPPIRFRARPEITVYDLKAVPPE